MTTFRIVDNPFADGPLGLTHISADGTTAAGTYSDSSGFEHDFVYDIATGRFTTVAQPGILTSSVVGLSADGSIVAATSTVHSGEYVSFVENVATGVQTQIVDPNGFGFTSLVDLSEDGSEVLGSYPAAGQGSTRGFVENLTTQHFTEIADPNATKGTFVSAISGDGSIVGGSYLGSSGENVGFVFNVATGEYTDVADPNAPEGTLIRSISADGSKVAGEYNNGTGGSGAFVEDFATGTYREVSDPNAIDSSTGINAISADGSTVVGNYYNGADERAFVLNLATGVYTDISGPPGADAVGTNVIVSAISGDGSTVVGGYYNPTTGIGSAFIATDIPCYARGTSVLTVSGEVAVEDLAVGDLVVTAAGKAKPIVWLGRRIVDCTRHPAPGNVWPIRILAGAFGEKMPRRDLWLSPGHSVAFEGALIQAERLVNGRSIVQVERDRIEYWHIELDVHDVIFAEGLPAETYLDTGNRTAFANGGAFVEAHPDFRPNHWAQTCLPLVLDGAPLIRARAQLCRRLASLGFETTTEPDLHMLADGARIAPVKIGANRFAFILPSRCAEFRLASRSFVPGYVSAESEDFRVLGVCVGRLQIDDDEIALDDAAHFQAGWHACEQGRRWTDGAAALPVKARLVIVDLVGEGRYEREARAGGFEMFARRA